MKILVTGGAGFIGSNFIHYWIKNHPDDQIVNLDKLTYAGHIESLKDLEGNPNYQFIQGDICDLETDRKAMKGVDIVVHFAAESHVDRSIMDAEVFGETNVMGTLRLLMAAREAKVKRFHHVSTDEVYGHLELNDPPFTSETPYNPRSPYSASKAGSDHFVRAFFYTYGLPITISNCANNFGPFHDPEKYIPRGITNLVLGKKIPVMGKGENVREWLHVEDHARAIEIILEKGEVGETYLIQGEERPNIEIARQIIRIMGKSEDDIEFIEDRISHDFRYANDGQPLEALGFERIHSIDEDLPKIVKWYQDNRLWWEPLLKDRPNIDPDAQKGLK